MVRYGLKQVSTSFLPVLVILMLCLSACENDLENIRRISAMETSQPVDTTRGVEVIYSDSAIVKGKMLTPLLLKYSAAKNPYDVMPKGIKIIFYDKDRAEIATLVADSAVQLETENITKFYRNVLVTTPKGDSFKSEELIWDQPKKIIYSNKYSEAKMADGNEARGISFMSDDKFEHPEFRSGTGIIQVPENQTQ